MKASFDC